MRIRGIREEFYKNLPAQQRRQALFLLFLLALLVIGLVVIMLL